MTYTQTGALAQDRPGLPLGQECPCVGGGGSVQGLDELGIFDAIVVLHDGIDAVAVLVLECLGPNDGGGENGDDALDLHVGLDEVRRSGS